MKGPRIWIGVGLAVVCLAIVAVYLLFPPNPYGRMERMARDFSRLSLPGSQPDLSDRFIGLLHRKKPEEYYVGEALKEEAALLASGHLVRTRIAMSGARSGREVYQALHGEYLKSGRYYSATIDLTNRVVLLVSKSNDVAAFKAVLEGKLKWE